MNVREVREWATLVLVVVTLAFVVYLAFFSGPRGAAPESPLTAGSSSGSEAPASEKNLQEACDQMRQKALTDTKMSKDEKSALNSQISRHC